MDDDKFMWLAKEWSRSKQTLGLLILVLMPICGVCILVNNMGKFGKSLTFWWAYRVYVDTNWLIAQFSLVDPLVATMRLWWLWCWRRCSVPSNLFITLRLLLYFSSIFHESKSLTACIQSLIVHYIFCLCVPYSHEFAYVAELEWKIFFTHCLMQRWQIHSNMILLCPNWCSK